MSAPATTAAELVPLAERLRYLQLFRLVVAATALLFGALAPALLGIPFGALAAGTALYAATAAASEGIWRLFRQRALFGAMLIVDGVYLAWLTYATGGTGSPLRFLILLHLVAVALLASYRTGLKLALWHSLLLFVVYHAQEAGILGAPGGLQVSGSAYQQLTAFVVGLWLVAIATSSFSAINERELRRRRVDLEALAVLATQLEGATDSRAVADVLLDNLNDAFDFERLLLFASGDEALTLLASRGVERPSVADVSPSAGSIVTRAIESRTTMLVSELDPAADRWVATLVPQSRNLVVVPLVAETGCIGALVVEHGLKSGSRIERRVVSMVERFAAHGALALLNAQLLEHVQRLAALDGLTLVANRRTFETVLARELSRATRTGEELSLVMLDIDHFKQLNDQHGHQAGDEVLRQVARILDEHSRDFDTTARYGGEEFAVVLPNCSAADSLEIAERLRRAVAEAETAVPVTASLGVATFPTHARDEPALIGAADEALYESKRNGRNRVTGSARRGHLVALRSAS